MARDAELIKLRDARIREVYERMRKKRTNGKPIYTVDHIIFVISTEHVFISPERIRRILYSSTSE